MRISHSRFNPDSITVSFIARNHQVLNALSSDSGFSVRFMLEESISSDQLYSRMAHYLYHNDMRDCYEAQEQRFVFPPDDEVDRQEMYGEFHRNLLSNDDSVMWRTDTNTSNLFAVSQDSKGTNTFEKRFQGNLGDDSARVSFFFRKTRGKSNKDLLLRLSMTLLVDEVVVGQAYSEVFTVCSSGKRQSITQQSLHIHDKVRDIFLTLFPQAQSSILSPLSDTTPSYPWPESDDERIVDLHMLDDLSNTLLHQSTSLSSSSRQQEVNTGQKRPRSEVYPGFEYDYVSSLLDRFGDDYPTNKFDDAYFVNIRGSFQNLQSHIISRLNRDVRIKVHFCWLQNVSMYIPEVDGYFISHEEISCKVPRLDLGTYDIRVFIDGYEMLHKHPNQCLKLVIKPRNIVVEEPGRVVAMTPQILTHQMRASRTAGQALVSTVSNTIGSLFRSTRSTRNSSSLMDVGGPFSLMSAPPRDGTHMMMESVGREKGVSQNDRCGRNEIHMLAGKKAEKGKLEALLEQNNNNEIESLLLKQDKLGRVPLHYAIISRNFDIARLLIERGNLQQLRMRDFSGRLALEYGKEMAECSRRELLDFILEIKERYVQHS